MLWAGQLSQVFSVGPVKVSVIFLYRRIFRGPIFNIITWILTGLVAAWAVAYFFANLLECVPIEESFKAAPGQGGNPHCVDAIPMYFSQVYSDVLLDILILIVPIPSGGFANAELLSGVCTDASLHSLETDASCQTENNGNRSLPFGYNVSWSHAFMTLNSSAKHVTISARSLQVPRKQSSST